VFGVLAGTELFHIQFDTAVAPHLVAELATTPAPAAVRIGLF
jgi:hypothetical protein